MEPVCAKLRPVRLVVESEARRAPWGSGALLVTWPRYRVSRRGHSGRDISGMCRYCGNSPVMCCVDIESQVSNEPAIL